MGKMFFLLFFLPLTSFAAQYPAPAPADAAEKLSSGKEEIESRIRSDLFFRGEVADSIADSDYLPQIMENYRNLPYSEIRESLIWWVEKNPSAAAEIYLEIERGKEAGERAVTYRKMKYKINPHFKMLIDRLNEAVSDMSLSDEDLHLESKRLFEGMPTDVNYADFSYKKGSGEREKERGTSRGTPFRYANYKTNKSAIRGEISFLEKQKKFLERIRNNSATGNITLKKYGEFLASYRNFTALALSLKASKFINREHSSALERERVEARKKILETYIAAMLDYAAKTVGESSEKSLRGFARQTFGFIKTMLSEAESGENRNLKEIFRGNYIPSLKAFNSLALCGYLENIKRQIDSVGFSCLYDRLYVASISRISPESAYPSNRKKLREYSQKIGEILEGISGVENIPPKETIMEISSKSARLISNVKRASLVNRKTQIIFWNIWFHQFEFISEKGKVKIRYSAFPF